MTDPAVPYDAEAEHAVAAAALLSPVAAADAAEFGDADFYLWLPGRVFLAAQLASVKPLEGFARVEAIAALTDQQPDELEDFIQLHATYILHGPQWHARLRDATQRRRLMFAAARVYDALGAGATLEEIAPLLEAIAA